MKRTWLLAVCALPFAASIGQTQSARSHSRRISTGEAISASNSRFVSIVGTVGGLSSWNYDFYVEGASPSNFSTYDYSLYYDSAIDSHGRGKHGSVDFLEQVGMGFGGAENFAFAYLSADVIAESLSDWSRPETEPRDLTVSPAFGLSPYVSAALSGEANAGADGSLQISAAAIDSTVPEPSTYALMGSGLIALSLLALRRRKAHEP